MGRWGLGVALISLSACAGSDEHEQAHLVSTPSPSASDASNIVDAPIPTALADATPGVPPTYALCEGGSVPALPPGGVVALEGEPPSRDSSIYPRPAGMAREGDLLYLLDSDCYCYGKGCLAGAYSCAFTVRSYDLCVGALTTLDSGPTSAAELTVHRGAAFWIFHGEETAMRPPSVGAMRRRRVGESNVTLMRGDETPEPVENPQTVLDIRRLTADEGLLYVLEADTTCLSGAIGHCVPLADARRRIVRASVDAETMATSDAVTVVLEALPGSSEFDVLDATKMLVLHDQLYLLSGGTLYRLPVAGGAVTAMSASPTDVTDFLVAGSTVFASTGDGRIVDLTSPGAPVVVASADGRAEAPFAVSGDFLYFTSVPSAPEPVVNIGDASTPDAAPDTAPDAARDASWVDAWMASGPDGEGGMGANPACWTIRHVPIAGGIERTVLQGTCDTKPAYMVASDGQILVSIGSDVNSAPYSELVGSVIALPDAP